MSPRLSQKFMNIHYPSDNVPIRVIREQRASRGKREILNAHETSPINVVVVVVVVVLTNLYCCPRERQDASDVLAARLTYIVRHVM